MASGSSSSSSNWRKMTFPWIWSFQSKKEMKSIKEWLLSGGKDRLGLLTSLPSKYWKLSYAVKALRLRLPLSTLEIQTGFPVLFYDPIEDHQGMSLVESTADMKKNKIRANGISAALASTAANVAPTSPVPRLEVLEMRFGGRTEPPTQAKRKAMESAAPNKGKTTHLDMKGLTNPEVQLELNEGIYHPADTTRVNELSNQTIGTKAISFLYEELKRVEEADRIYGQHLDGILESKRKEKELAEAMEKIVELEKSLDGASLENATLRKSLTSLRRP